MIRVATIALLLLLPVSLSAKTVIYDFESRVRRSDVIVEAVAVNVKRRILSRDVACFEPKAVLKGKPKAGRICVRFGNRPFAAREDKSKFRAGATYFLFLTRADDAYELVGAHQGYCELNETDGVLCDGGKSTRDSFLERVRQADGNGDAQ